LPGLLFAATGYPPTTTNASKVIPIVATLITVPLADIAYTRINLIPNARQYPSRMATDPMHPGTARFRGTETVPFPIGSPPLRHAQAASASTNSGNDHPPGSAANGIPCNCNRPRLADQNHRLANVTRFSFWEFIPIFSRMQVYFR
jgi:hypothetical protein